MSFLQRELDKITSAILDDLNKNELNNTRHAELRAAQQALAWASDPTAFRSPFDMVTGASMSAPSMPPA